MQDDYLSYEHALQALEMDTLKARRVAKKIDSGVIWINCWLVRDLRTPFGGLKQSGLGKEGGEDVLRFFTEQKNICIQV